MRAIAFPQYAFALGMGTHPALKHTQKYAAVKGVDPQMVFQVYSRARA